jgi:hypothetical protein
MFYNKAVFYFYALAIFFAPFDFFMFQERNSLGISATFSKFFQLMTYILIIISFLVNYKYIKIQNFINLLKLHKVFLLFIVVALISTIYGLSNDSYNSNIQDLLYNLSIYNFSHLKIYFRPIFEIFIEAHKYLFFIILAPLILSNEKRVGLILNIFFIIITSNLIFAFIDYALTFYHYELIPRHLVDWRHVGNRLHGFFGEPRDAYVGLVFSLCFIFIYNEHYNSKKPSYFWAVLFTLSLFFTNSTSGILGSLSFVIGLFLYAMIKPKEVYLNPQIRIWLLIILTLIILYFVFSVRFQFYFIQLLKFVINLLEQSKVIDQTNFIISFLKSFQDFFERLIRSETRIDQAIKYYDSRIITDIIPAGHTKSLWGLNTHQVNLLPIIQLMSRFENIEFWKIIFGTGSNSISFYNNELLKINELSNSHSKFINLLFNYGILGTFLVIFSLWHILKSSFLQNSSITKETQIGVFCVVLFSNFIHDGYFLYLLVGLLIVNNRINKKMKQMKI